jgi:hypothetical protein
MIKNDPNFFGLFDDLPFSSSEPNPINKKIAPVVEKFGRENLVFENDYLIKYQGFGTPHYRE